MCHHRDGFIEHEKQPVISLPPTFLPPSLPTCDTLPETVMRVTQSNILSWDGGTDYSGRKDVIYSLSG